MAIFNDFDSKKDLFELIDKFNESPLFELDISIPIPQPQCIKIKMMKLSQDNPDDPATRVTIEDSEGIEEDLEIKRDRSNHDLPGDKGDKLIKSPLVGIFYSSPAPDSNPYVKAGDKISKGMVIYIIEAMKIMNEIESEKDGEIAEILVENGSPVEYGQVIFRLK